MNQMGKFVRGDRSSFQRLGDKTVVPQLARGDLIGFGGFQFVFRTENGLNVFHYPFVAMLTAQAKNH